MLMPSPKWKNNINKNADLLPPSPSRQKYNQPVNKQGKRCILSDNAVEYEKNEGRSSVTPTRGYREGEEERKGKASSEEGFLRSDRKGHATEITPLSGPAISANGFLARCEKVGVCGGDERCRNSL